MFIRVILKGRMDGVKGDAVDFAQGDGYLVTEEGDLDIYNGNDAIATVNHDVWMYAEKVFEDGEEIVVPEVSPADAESLAEFVAENPSQVRVDNLGFGQQISGATDFRP